MQPVHLASKNGAYDRARTYNLATRIRAIFRLIYVSNGGLGEARTHNLRIRNPTLVQSSCETVPLPGFEPRSCSSPLLPRYKRVALPLSYRGVVSFLLLHRWRPRKESNPQFDGLEDRHRSNRRGLALVHRPGFDPGLPSFNRALLPPELSTRNWCFASESNRRSGSTKPVACH